MNPEIEHYLQLFEQMQTDAAAALAGLPPKALNWRPLEGDEATNALAMLAAHLAGSQRFWVGEVAGDRPAHRDRDSEFRATAASADELLTVLRQAGEHVRETLTELAPEKLEETVQTRSPRGALEVTRRWAVLHALTHCFTHVGHMQLTRQLWEAHAAEPN